LSYALTIPTNVATTVSIGAAPGSGLTAKGYAATLLDNYGLITGLIAGEYNLYKTVGTTATLSTDVVAWSVPVPALGSTVSGNAVSLVIPVTDTSAGTVNATFNISQAAASPETVLVDPSSLTATTYSIRAAVGSTNSFRATVLDQYSNVMSGQAVTAAVAGRNATVVSTNLVTDANGQTAAFSLADTSTSTLSLTDTLTFTTTTGSKVGTVTVNYATYNPVSTITITGGASADVAPAVTYSQITAGTAGPTAGAVTMTATLKDANGATLPAGIPVTWAISGLTGTSAIWVDPDTGYDWKTSYTNSNGQAITYVYAWAHGTVSVTATSGAVTSATAGKINFAQKSATDDGTSKARVVSATVTGNIITAKVVDRYGNALEGVSLTAVRNSGTGYFSGAASSSATGTTGANGTVDFVTAGGPANITIKTSTLNFGQTSSAASQVNGTAITAGSVGASLSPVGVQSVTVDVTAADPGQLAAEAASDAAAEAIDAANAATDAANLAAEAADAATVAAEEARDAADAATAAVEELATQVATLMAAMKAQLTTLANTVAKIAKKVKA